MPTQTLQNFNYAKTVTKSDTVNMPTFPASDGRYPDAIWAGEAGVVVLVFPDESVIPFTVAAGSLLPVRAKRINSTNTAGTLFVGLWQV